MRVGYNLEANICVISMHINAGTLHVLYPSAARCIVGVLVGWVFFCFFFSSRLHVCPLVMCATCVHVSSRKKFQNVYGAAMSAAALVLRESSARASFISSGEGRGPEIYK